MSEDDYPYQAMNRNQCDFVKEKSIFSPDSYTDIPIKDELALKQFVSNQPVSTCLAASSKTFQFYSSGIIDQNSDCGITPDHCVGVVGFGSEEGKKFWIVKNSWGDQWGEKVKFLFYIYVYVYIVIFQGFVRILRNESSGSIGTCAIASEPRVVNWKVNKSEKY